MLAVKWFLLAMDKDGRMMFWCTWCCKGVSKQFLFILFLFPLYQITCMDFVLPFGDKSP
jgi:hypothetical protein